MARAAGVSMSTATPLWPALGIVFSPELLGSTVLLLVGGLGGLLGAWRAAAMPSGAPTRWKGSLRCPRLVFGYGAAIGGLSLPGLYPHHRWAAERR